MLQGLGVPATFHDTVEVTLGVAWIRSVGGVRELVVASDSRLSAGPERWDACPKILTLPRSDAVISFSGVTELAYPAMLQVHRAIEVHPALVDRRFDITQVSSLVEDVLNQMVGLVRSSSQESLKHSLGITEFLLSGFSWRLQEFRIWRYYWSNVDAAYVKGRCLKQHGFSASQIFRFIGDPMPRATHLLKEELRSKGKLGRGAGLDMEPLNIIESFVGDADYPSVGGAPQVVKVYRHLNTETFSVLWPNSTHGHPTFAGRPLLDYEKSFTPPIDLERPAQHSARLVTDSGAIDTEATDEQLGLE